LKFEEEILLNFKPRRLSDYSFEIYFKSEEVSMDNVVPLIKPFKTIFYFKFSEPRGVLFELVKVWEDLNSFEPV
jgi:hypothetical protein